MSFLDPASSVWLVMVKVLDIQRTSEHPRMLAMEGPG